MRNLYNSPASFWQERDFGTKISAVFEFIGAHWRTLGKCLLYFVLPCTLLMGIGLGIMTNSMFDRMGGIGGLQPSRRLGGPAVIAHDYGSSSFGASIFGGMGVGLLGTALSFLLLTGTIYGYLRARLRLPAEQPVTPADVWTELKSRLGYMLLVIIVLVTLYLGTVFGFIALIGLFSRGGGMVGTVLSFPLIGAVAIYISVTLSLFFPVMWLENIGLFQAIGRCFQLIKGHWWATFGLLLVVGMIQSMLSIVFVIPQYLVMFGKMLHWPVLSSDVLGLVAQCFYAVGLIFTYTLPLLATAFQYFNLAEQKEGWGLRLLMDELGQPKAVPVAQSGHYRPDDEGEY